MKSSSKKKVFKDFYFTFTHCAIKFYEQHVYFLKVVESTRGKREKKEIKI